MTEILIAPSFDIHWDTLDLWYDLNGLPFLINERFLVSPVSTRSLNIYSITIIQTYSVRSLRSQAFLLAFQFFTLHSILGTFGWIKYSQFENFDFAQTQLINFMLPSISLYHYHVSNKKSFGEYMIKWDPYIWSKSNVKFPSYNFRKHTSLQSEVSFIQFLSFSLFLTPYFISLYCSCTVHKICTILISIL